MYEPNPEMSEVIAGTPSAIDSSGVYPQGS